MAKAHICPGVIAIKPSVSDALVPEQHRRSAAAGASAPAGHDFDEIIWAGIASDAFHNRIDISDTVYDTGPNGFTLDCQLCCFDSCTAPQLRKFDTFGFLSGQKVIRGSILHRSFVSCWL